VTDVDVVCVGDPFLDLIFLGLPAFPALGEERLAQRLKIVPGGMGNVAFALRRLGLEAVICAPKGRDLAGRLLAELMADVGVPWHGRPAEATPVTVALPVDGDRALVSLMPQPAVDAETLRGMTMRAVVVDLPSVPLVLPLAVGSGARVYAVVGDPEVAAMAGQLPASLADVRALVLNEREAIGLTGRSGARSAATQLASLGTTVVVTRGADGVLAVELDGGVIEVPARAAHVADATGAGDLFVSAYVWADLAGLDLEERLGLATTYASLSLERATDTLKGITVAELEEIVAR
jgi:ribokinase